MSRMWRGSVSSGRTPSRPMDGASDSRRMRSSGMARASGHDIGSVDHRLIVSRLFVQDALEARGEAVEDVGEFVEGVSAVEDDGEVQVSGEFELGFQDGDLGG